MMLFNEGLAYIGEVKTVSLPTLTRKMEEYRGAGMSGPIMMDMGQEALELSFTCGGPMRDVLRQYGATRVNGVYLRFAGSYQRDDSSAVDNIELIVRGRHSEIEMGDQEVGEVGEFSVTSALAYYKLVWNGRTEIEIDPLNMVEIVGGVDRLAEQRAALGIF
jgi:P2 family phage contractile tail tube protein